MQFRLLCCLAVLLLGACASVPQSAALQRQAPPELLDPVALAQVPFFPQDLYQCGPAALATVLVVSGVTVTPAELVPLVYLPERKGSFQIEIVAAARSHGRLAYEIAPELSALFAQVQAGKPVLVLQNLGVSWYPRWHFAVVKGFDLAERTVLMNSGVNEDYVVSLATFERTWARAQYWGLLVLATGEMPVSADAAVYFRAVAALEATQPDADIALAYASGLQRWPDDRDLLMGYGNLAYGNGDVATAAARFARVIALHEDYAPAWNNLAQILYERGELMAARAHALRAVTLGGAFSGTYSETLATIEAGMQRAATPR